MPQVKPHARPSSQKIANTLALLATKLPRTLRAMDAAPKLTISESSALGVLVHAGAMNLGKLAEYEQVTPASISRTIKVLEKRGLASRTRDEADGRGSVVQSTALGTRVFKEGHKRKLAPLVEWADQLPSKDRARLHGVLDLLDAAALLELQK
jgi:DNA-binding MarR family transcriptional regulator